MGGGTESLFCVQVIVSEPIKTDVLLEDNTQH